MPGAGGKAQAFGGAAEQGAAFGVGFGDGGQQGAVGVGVAARLRPVADTVGKKTGGEEPLPSPQSIVFIEDIQRLTGVEMLVEMVAKKTDLDAAADAWPALAKLVEEPRGATADLLAPLGQGFDAYARGDWTRAAEVLELLLATHERLGGSRAQRDLLEYLVTSAMLHAGRTDAARSLISTRRPQNGKGGGFPLAGL